MRIVQIIPDISQESSGPTYSVVRLCQAVAKHASKVTLAAREIGDSLQYPELAKFFRVGRGPLKLGRSPDMYKWLRTASQVGQIDLLHNHGMWQMNGIYPARVARRFKIPLVASPRGACSTWAMAHGSKFKKIFWYALQRSALQQANCFHATATSEMHDIRRLNFRQPVAIIPNGIDVPELMKPSEHPLRTLLFLGRVHPVKGLESLLEAWHRVQDRHLDWQLSIAGSDEDHGKSTGYLERIQVLSRTLGAERVKFIGELHGEEKQREFAKAELFVLPSHSENFGIAVAEALAAGTPAIVSKGAPWEGLISNQAGWHVDIGADALEKCFDEALRCSRAQLRQMGLSGRSWMLREYSWESIGTKMYETYRWLAGLSKEVPAWVYMDQEKP